MSGTPTPARPSPTTLTEGIAFYGEHTVAITPVRRGEKKGYRKGWSQPGHSSTASDFKADDNIGGLNGTPVPAMPGFSFYDVDIDANSDAARLIVRRLLPQTGWAYGRESKPQSHLNYLAKGTLRTRQYFGVDDKVILELRGVTSKGTHSLSVVPGSVHASGEPIRFCDPRGPIGVIDNPRDLALAVQHAAIGIVILQVWPAGGRHRLRLAFAKVLLQHELAPDVVTRILQAVMEATGSQTDDVEPAVRSTVEALSSGRPTEGASGVRAVLGDDRGGAVLAALARILGIQDGIVMRGGELPAIVDKAEAALIRGRIPIYQRGGVLTRVVRIDTPTGSEAAVRREIGSTVLATVRDAWLLEQMARASRWYRAGEKATLADPNPIYARTLLSRSQWAFPVLRGVKTAPTLGADGRIIEQPGFDVESGLLLDIAVGAFPPVPPSPTLNDARVALECLARPLRGFPFVSDAARSVALSAMLTALVRASVRTAPLHGIDAPQAGTGKSLLAEGPGLLATGYRPAALSQGRTAEEDEKRLATVLFAGDPVIHIDNCTLQITGDFLCSMLTQEVVQARILGMSERRILPCTSLVLASGNNLTFAGDTSRRAVICRLDAGIERPDTREFDFDFHDEVLADRAALVVAGLTVLRAYVVAGRPVKLMPMGSFADWDWVRGALVWLGCADPADTRDAILDADPRKDELIDVLDLWIEAFGSQPVEVSEIGERADGYAKDYSAVEPRDRVKVLRDKLIEVACRGAWSGKSVGWWLRRHKDRVVGGRCLRSEAGRDGMRWWVAVEGRPRAESLPLVPVQAPEPSPVGPM